MKLGLLFLAVTLGACCATHPAEYPNSTALAAELTSDTVAMVENDGTSERVYCSGVWISPTEILTAAHCVSDHEVGDPLSYSMRDDVWHVGSALYVTPRPATLKRVDGVHDLALVTVATPPPHTFASGAFGRAPLTPGMRVFTMGHPLGLWWSYSSGDLAAVRYLDDGLSEPAWWVQVTAPISPGNSGGGLFDAQGHLLGICHGTFTEGQNLNLYIHPQYIEAFLGAS